MNRPPAQEGWPHFGAILGRRWRGVWRVGTLVACGMAAYALIFHVPFSEPHVFVRPRRWHAKAVDHLLGLPSNNHDKQ